MFTFPTYHGELPQCLNPLNLRHYFLLAYWVYFRPTALTCYLYQADPDLYRSGPGLGIFHILRVPAYRNLYLIMPGVILLFSVLVGLPIVLVTGWIQGMPINWLMWTVGVAWGAVGGGVVLGLLVGVVFGVVFGVAAGVVFGMVPGVAVGVATGVAGGVAAGVLDLMLFGIAASVVFGVAVGVALGVVWGKASSVIVGVAASVAAGVCFGMVFSVAFNVVFGVVFGVTVGVTGGIGALRVPFYPFQLGLALRSMFWEGAHPLEWDEWVVLPLPCTRQVLARRLQEDESDGLRFLAEVARNPLHRWAAQRVLQAYLHNQESPLRFLYALLASPDLNDYISAPVSKVDWEQLPSIRQLLLGELDRRWVDCSSELMNRLAERLVWALTWLLRDRRKTPLTRFVSMIYQLLDLTRVASTIYQLQDLPRFASKARQMLVLTLLTDGLSHQLSTNLFRYRQVYNGLGDYPGGVEIGRSFTAMAIYLSYDDLMYLASAVSWVPGFAQCDSPVRPAVLTALAHLRKVGAEVATYRDATSRVNQLAALARATDALDALDEYVLAEVMAPERTILRQIIRQWRRLVSEAGGQVGRAEEVHPVINPYVVGNPVSGDLFVGRENILRRLEELWTGEGQKPSVVLYGHRRMGKSSILHNLGARFGPRTVIVDFNMQRVGLVASTGELLYNLALALYDAQTLGASETPRVLEEPDETHFTPPKHSPYTAFDRFLKKRLDRVRAGRRFIVTIDEFELIEKWIAEGRLEPDLLGFWRSLIQTYPWFVMAFAGLHTLQEMTQDYWHPLYGSVTAVPVSFLTHDAAWRLITQPTPDFSLDYDTDAVERIIALTHGQPYLVQLIGHGLVTRFNRQTFEEGVERERRFTLADVEAVIGAPEFYRDGDAYFTGVWRQAKTSEPPGQTAVLRALARSEAGIPLEEIARQAGLALEEVRSVLETLVRHDVVMEEDGSWQFTVELMRRWVVQR